MTNITIKEYSGSTWRELYPKTSLTQVTGLVDSNGKLNISLMPDVIIDGMNRIGSITLTGTTAVFDSIKNANEKMKPPTVSKGDYWIIAHATANTSITITESGTSDDVFLDPTLGTYTATSIIVNPGDWIVYDGFENSKHLWAIINNNASNLYSPIGHAHGNITSEGSIGNTAGLAVITGTAGKLTTGVVPVASGGTGATTASEARSNLGAANAVHNHGNISSDGKIGSAADLPIMTTTGGLLAAVNVDTFRDKIYAAPAAIGSEGNYYTGTDTVGAAMQKVDNAVQTHKHDDVYAKLVHAHGNISSDGKIGSVADLPLITTAGGLVSTIDAATFRTKIGAGTSNLSLGNGSGNAYYGDKGKVAYDHSQATGNPHGATGLDLAIASEGTYYTGTDTIATALQNVDVELSLRKKITYGSSAPTNPSTGDIWFAT